MLQCKDLRSKCQAECKLLYGTIASTKFTLNVDVQLNWNIDVNDTKLQISFKMRDCVIAVNALNSDLHSVHNWCFKIFYS